MLSIFRFLILALPLVSFAQEYVRVLPNHGHYDGNIITHLKNGEALSKARTDLIFSATTSIYLSTFTMSSDDVGQGIFDLLCYKAKLGVEVRVTIDHRSSKKFHKYTMKLRKCGAYTISFRPDDRMYALHEKLLIVDGERMIMGGSNYSKKYHIAGPHSHLKGSLLRRKGKNGWYDSDYKIEGPAACSFHTQFRNNFIHLASHWADYNQELSHYGADYFKTIHNKYYGMGRFKDCVSRDIMGDERVIPILSQPYKKSDRPSMEAHLDAIAQTKKGEQIHVYAPYFIPGPSYVKALGDAVKRGVDVKVITNSVESNDEQSMGNILFIGMIEAIKPMLSVGVKVYLWNVDSTIHRKGGMYGKVAFFGSDNLDNRGQEYSSESIVFTDSKKIVEDAYKEFDADLNRGTMPLTQKYIKKIYDQSSWLEIQAGKKLKKYF